MRNRVAAGVAAGLLGGLAFGAIMQVMTAPTPEGNQVPMMMMVAMVVRSESLLVGWLYHLFNSAVIGALFAAFLGSAADASPGRSVALGIGWGALWWILGALILMPLLLGMPAFAALRMPRMRPVAMGSLAGHIVYGLLLGLVYGRLRRTREVPSSVTSSAAHIR
jgi:hypothetical protein